MTTHQSPPAPGAYDFRDLYRPTSPDDLAAAIRRMAAQGLKPRDVASMMRLDIAVVLEALRSTP